MTAREEAIELCEKSASILGYYKYHISNDVKDVALFSVDGMLDFAYGIEWKKKRRRYI